MARRMHFDITRRWPMADREHFILEQVAGPSDPLIDYIVQTHNDDTITDMAASNVAAAYSLILSRAAGQAIDVEVLERTLDAEGVLDVQLGVRLPFKAEWTTLTIGPFDGATPEAGSAPGP